jgi:hypothetical protein
MEVETVGCVADSKEPRARAFSEMLLVELVVRWPVSYSSPMEAPIRIDSTARGKVWSRRVRIEEADDRFDLAFWQAQSAAARLAAGWELVETAWEMKGRSSDELRLQRTVGRFVPFPG